MGQITTDQSHEVMSILATNVAWKDIDFDASGLQDSVIRNRKEAGVQFAAFLKNGCRLMVENFFRETGELSIEIPALQRPTLAELRTEFPWIKEEGGIVRDTSPEGPVTLKLGTVLRPEEKKSIGGTEYERRLLPIQNDGLALGYQHREWLINQHGTSPEMMALLGKIYIDFSGLVVLSGDGNRSVPYARSDSGRWVRYWFWLAFVFDPYGRIAVSGK